MHVNASRGSACVYDSGFRPTAERQQLTIQTLRTSSQPVALSQAVPLSQSAVSPGIRLR